MARSDAFWVLAVGALTGASLFAGCAAQLEEDPPGNGTPTIDPNQPNTGGSTALGGAGTTGNTGGSGITTGGTAQAGTSGGTAVGGTTPSGGTGTAGTTTSTAGTQAGGTAGVSAGGMTAGGTAGGTTAGANAGGSTGGGTATCAGTVPPGAYLTDFSDYDEDAHSGDGGWGNTAMGMTGGLFEFGGITTMVAEALTASGNVSDYGAGFGMWFLTCTDASAYSGITFTLDGDPGPDGITVKVQTFGNSPEEGAGCTPTDPAAPWESCTLPAKTGVMPGTVTLTWADFTGGLPTPSVTPNEVLGIQWEFAWSDAATAYDVDVTVDDVAFAP